MDQVGQPDRVRAAVGVAVLHIGRRPRHRPAVRLLVLGRLAEVVVGERHFVDDALGADGGVDVAGQQRRHAAHLML